MARDTRKLRYWTEHIRHWQTNGLTQQAYCAGEGIKWPTFDYWRRQILSGTRTSPLLPRQNSCRLNLKTAVSRFLARDFLGIDDVEVV